VAGTSSAFKGAVVGARGEGIGKGPTMLGRGIGGGGSGAL
jgi:hypothetical protein